MVAHILGLFTPAVYGRRWVYLIRWIIIWILVITLVLAVRMPMS